MMLTCDILRLSYKNQACQNLCFLAILTSECNSRKITYIVKSTKKQKDKPSRKGFALLGKRYHKNFEALIFTFLLQWVEIRVMCIDVVGISRIQTDPIRMISINDHKVGSFLDISLEHKISFACSNFCLSQLYAIKTKFGSSNISIHLYLSWMDSSHKNSVDFICFFSYLITSRKVFHFFYIYISNDDTLLWLR